MQSLYNYLHSTLTLYFYLLFAAIPVIFAPINSELFEFPKMIATYVLSILVVSSWILKSVISGKIIFRRTPLDLPLLLFLTAQFTSTFFSVNQHTSIWSFYSRFQGGLLSLVTYALLYWAYVANMGEKETKKVIKILLASIVVVSLYGILERFGISLGCLTISGKLDVSCWTPNVQARVFATFGQPNWLAAWLVAILPLSWAKLITTRHLPFTILPFLCLLFTSSRSGLIAFGVTFLVFWGSVIFRKPELTVFRKFLLIAICYLLFASLFGTTWTPPANTVIAQLIARPSVQTQTSDSPQPSPPPSVGTESLDIRKIVWVGAINIWKHYPLTGSGPETFAYTYYNHRPAQHNYTSEWDLLYNKAHNEYLNYLANTGLFGLVTYILLILTSLYVILSRARLNEGSRFFTHLALSSGFISILITNYVGFSVVTINLLFFLYPALSISLIKTRTPPATRHSPPAIRYSLCQSVFCAICILSTCYLLFTISKIYLADTHYAKGVASNKNGDGHVAAENLRIATKLWPTQARYWDELAKSTSLLATTYAESIDEKSLKTSGEFAAFTEEFSNTALHLNSANIVFWTNRASNFKRLASTNPKYLDLAIEAATQATLLAPTEPKIRYNLGVLYERAGNIKKAIEVLEESTKLKTDYKDPRFAIAKIYIENGQKEMAQEQLNYILEKIDPHEEETQALLQKLQK